MRADDPRQLAKAICALLPMTAGTLTNTMSRTDHRIGLFLREITRNGVRPLQNSSTPAHPLLVGTKLWARATTQRSARPSVGSFACSSSTSPSSLRRRLAEIYFHPASKLP